MLFLMIFVTIFPLSCDRLFCDILQVKKLEKVVLVSMGVNTRHVSFSTAESVTDTEALMQAIRTTFKDNLQSGQEFSLQLKSEEWGGEFIDLQGTQEIADRSVVRAKPRPLTLTEVS